MFSPVVLADSRLVATWKTVTERQRTLLEITMMPGQSVLGEDAFADQIIALSRVLALDIGEVRVRSPG